MNKSKLAAITLVMASMGVTLKELFDYQAEIGQSQYEELTAENEDEKKWLDENVRGKEEELRKLAYTGDDLAGEPIYRRIEVKDGDTTEEKG